MRLFQLHVLKNHPPNKFTEECSLVRTSNLTSAEIVSALIIHALESIKVHRIFFFVQSSDESFARLVLCMWCNYLICSLQVVLQTGIVVHDFRKRSSLFGRFVHICYNNMILDLQALNSASDCWRFCLAWVVITLRLV